MPPSFTPLRSLERGGVLEALQSAARLRRRPEDADLGGLVRLAGEGDVLARMTSAYALGRRPEAQAGHALLALLETGDPSLQEAAALALAERLPLSAARDPLTRLAREGGFGGMLAELALDDWSAAPGSTPARPARAGGLRVAQVFLQGRIDGRLSEAGAGDGGGLATLVVHLSRALGRRAEIAHAVTITRAVAGDPGSEQIDERASIERISFGPAGYLATGEMWEHRREAELALEHALRALLPLDAVHLRFADMGTLAAGRVCRRLGIPVVFTLAADPHVVIRAAEQAGTLDRDTWAAADRRDHFLLRLQLVESMLEDAEGLVVFPRPAAEAGAAELLGLDDADPVVRRLRTVPEGISLRTLDAAALATGTTPEPAGRAALRAAVAALPAHRAGLPLILSVGRLHRVKGFDRLVEAWADEPGLREQFNLAIVGGDLATPTAEEAGVLTAVREAATRHPGADDGLLLLGHRSHGDVAQIFHAARAGIPGVVGANGVYACASDKEEFGLALLEALGVGLAVVAPRTGGPGTYVQDGATGFLVDTTSVTALRDGLTGAVAVRHDELRARSAAELVRRDYSVDTMAAKLAALYLELGRTARLAAA